MSKSKKILHVGCGGKRENGVPEGFRGSQWEEIRLDINPAVEPDYVADICHMTPVAEGSMDALYSSHNIEHLYAHDVPRALAEFYRVLKEGGQLMIETPDLQRVGQFVAAGMLDKPLYVSPAGPISAIDIMYGLRPSMAAGNLFMAHKTGFTAHSLAARLLEAGFSHVDITRTFFDLHVTAKKLAVPSQPRTQYQCTDKGGPVPVVKAA